MYLRFSNLFNDRNILNWCIVTSPGHLFIKRTLDSLKFKKLMELCAVGQLTINHKVISTFRKDFWKDFIDD